MGTRSFRSVFMVASCAGAALGCYLVSLRVASERAALEDVETRIVLAQRDIRVLQTEIGTRGRLAQLERWNVKVLALSAPSADQFLDGGFALARLARPEPKAELSAPVVLASAPAETGRPQIAGLAPPADAPRPALSARDMMHVASLKRDPRADQTPAAPPRAAPVKPKASAAATPKTPPAVAGKTPAAKPVTTTAIAKSAPAPKKSRPAVEKAIASDPLSPLPTARAKPAKIASATPKDPARKQ